MLQSGAVPRNIQFPMLPLISEATQLTPFLRHLNAYLPRVVYVLAFSMIEWDSHFDHIKTFWESILHPFV